MDYPKISLKAARVNAELSQSAAARAIGISKSTLQNYEHGAAVPNWDVVKKMERVYRFPIDFIFFARNSA